MPGGPASWFVAETEAGENPWDAVHARVAINWASRIPISSMQSLTFLQHYDTANEHAAPSAAFAIGANCQQNPEETSGGPIAGPQGMFAWHLGDQFSELGLARDAITFTDPRIRIAHIDTKYDNTHSFRLEHSHRVGAELRNRQWSTQ